MEQSAPISIVIRSMDRPTLVRALDSVSAQTLKPAEIVVVAACGKIHKTLPRVHDAIHARLVFPPDNEPSLDRPRAANRGLDAVAGEWICFLDDDDEYLPHHLATLWEAAQRSYRAFGNASRLAYTLAQGIDASGRETDRYGRSFSLVQIWNNTILHTMNGLFHRSLLDEGCRFDESLDVLEDWDFWIQCAQKTHFTFVEKVTSLWHGDEGESGCGFGTNADGPKYSNAQQRVREKWEAVRAQAMDNLRNMRLTAHAARTQGDEEQAIRLSQWVLRMDPENADMANLLGMLVLKRGDVESAAQLIDAAIRNAPPNAGLCLNRGIVEQTRGNRDGAASWFARGLALDASHAGLRQRLAEVS